MRKFNPKNYWETRLRKYFDLQGVGYLRLGNSFNNWAYKVRRHVFIRRMNTTGINFSKVDVLDVGSGTGFYIDRLKGFCLLESQRQTDISNIESASRQSFGSIKHLLRDTYKFFRDTFDESLCLILMLFSSYIYLKLLTNIALV